MKMEAKTWSASSGRTKTPANRLGLRHPRAYLIALVVAGLLAVALGRRVFDTLGLPDYGHWFLDSYAILAANDAVTAGLNPYDSIPFDLLKRRHAYSTWWLSLRHVGLTRADNFLFGGVSVLGFLAIAIAGMRPRSAREAVFLATVMLSPPVLLAVNRANNDLILFALIGGAMLLAHRTSAPGRTTLLAVALVIATGLKFYPAAAILGLALLDSSARRGLRVTILAFAAAGAVLWSERTALARGAFVFPDSVYRFGSPVIWSGAKLGQTSVLALSAGLLAVVAWLLARGGLTRGLRDQSGENAVRPEADGARTSRLAADGSGSGLITHEAERWQFTVGGLILLGCFVAGTSFAYRWVFALWLVPWLWQQSTGGPRRGIARLALATVVVSLWQDGLFCAAIHLWFPTANPRIETVWRYVTQPINWVLMALIAGWLLEAAMQTSRQLIRHRADHA
jgi:hypothetical protein